jgi:hypothetical protein
MNWMWKKRAIPEKWDGRTSLRIVTALERLLVLVNTDFNLAPAVTSVSHYIKREINEKCIEGKLTLKYFAKILCLLSYWL